MEVKKTERDYGPKHPIRAKETEGKLWSTEVPSSWPVAMPSPIWKDFKN